MEIGTIIAIIICSLLIIYFWKKFYGSPKNNTDDKEQLNHSDKLTKCRSCQEVVSRFAKRCPHCGEYSPDARGHKAGKEVLIIVYILVLLILVLNILGIIKIK